MCIAGKGVGVPGCLIPAIQKLYICYSATMSNTLPQCRNHKRGCQVKERTDYSYCIQRKILFFIRNQKSTGEGIPYKCSNLIKKCSIWSSHLLQCESESLHGIKAGENQALLVPLLAKLVVHIPLSPLELLIISSQFQYCFFETYALNDFHFVPS